jgi:hypothetical protein
MHYAAFKYSYIFFGVKSVRVVEFCIAFAFLKAYCQWICDQSEKYQCILAVEEGCYSVRQILPRQAWVEV